MKSKDIIKNINAYKLENKKNTIQMNINEYNYIHNINLINKLKDYITEDNIIQYPSLNSDNQIKLTRHISNYLNIDINQILLLNGGDVTINNILKTYASNESNIIIYDPTYSQYERLSKSITSNIYNVDITNIDNLLNLEILTNNKNLNKNDNNKRTVCFICNPNNPTGSEWSESDLKQLFIQYPNILFVIDETYIDFSLLSNKHDNIYSCTDCINEYNNIIVMRSFSKAFGLAGLRISYIVSDNDNIESISSITSHKDITEFSKLTASLIFENLYFYKNQINNLMVDKKIIIDFCKQNEIKFIDTKCNFILIYAGNNTDKLSNMFLKNNILVKNLKGIHNDFLDNYIRLSLHSNYICEIIDILNDFTKYSK